MARFTGDRRANVLSGTFNADTIFGYGNADILAGSRGNDSLSGGDGDDWLYGGADDDRLDGGTGNDHLYGNDGTDTLLGLDGDDVLAAGGGRDHLEGGNGADRLYGGGDDDQLNGGADADWLYGNGDDDNLLGLAGNDTLVGGTGRDQVAGGDGLDRLYGGAGDDHLDGGAGDDQLFGNDDEDILLGLGGNDSLAGGVGRDHLEGGSDDDRLYGGAGDDHLDGGAGNDELYGNDDNDTLLGLAGNDILNGGAGSDQLSGGDDNDTLRGAGGIDTLVGGAGDDELDGGDDSDTLHGEAGNDILLGGAGSDQLHGGDDDDTLHGDAGNDTLLGGAGSDQLHGGDDDDTLHGEAGNDTLLGGAGSDLLDGGGDDDILAGGEGNDTLIWDDADSAIDGGDGSDTLRVSSGVLDLSASHAVLSNIEVIALSASAGLRLDAADVLAISASTGSLRVTGTTGALVDSTGLWTRNGVVTIDGVDYKEFQQGAAVLQVALAVDTQRIATLSSPLPLAGLDGHDGYALHGAEAAAQMGFRVAGVGDIDGDGFDDILIGAPYAAGGGSNRGEAYVISGKAGDFSAAVDLGTLNASDGLRITGIEDFAFAGRAVSAAGDINADGYADFMIGASQASGGGSSRGETFVILGKDDGFGGSIDLSTLDGDNGFRLTGFEDGAQSGRALASAGDVNGDGFGDLFIGAPMADGAGSNRGESYVVYGKADGFDATVNLATLDGSTGFKLVGALNNLQASFALASGDLNGDGLDDLVIGAPYAAVGGSNRGATYVVFGSTTPFAASLTLAGLDGSNGFAMTGFENNSFSGDAVATADVNGDGFDDLLIGAPYTNGGGSDRGQAYVVFGHAGPFTASKAMNLLNGSDGFSITGFENTASMSYSLSSAGDMNGDGYDDILIGARRADVGGSDRGQAYVIFGHASGYPVNFNLATLDGSNGLRLDGFENSARVGASVASAGDVDGDGYDDLLIGAPLTDVDGLTGSNHGESYLVFGRDFSGVVEFEGTAGADTLIGTTAAEQFVAGAGNDIVHGGGGADVYRSGAGDDRIEISDTSFLDIDGGAGTDTLALDGSGLSLDLTAFTAARLSGVERVDLTGAGDNALFLSARDLLNLSDTSNNLFIDGNSGDSVTMTDGGWTPGMVVGGYSLYTAGAATLWLDTDITVTV